MRPHDIAEAVRAELARRGTNAHRAAIEAGLPKNSIRYVLEGRATRSGQLHDICDALGLEFYVGPPRSKEPPLPSRRTPAILAYPVEAAEIAGAATPSGCMLFTATFLREFGLDPTQLLAIEIENDEMKPLLVTGGCAVVDVRLTDPVEGHIYAIATDDGPPMLRRAIRSDDGTWQTVRDVPIRAPREWCETGECLGQVVWASRMDF